MVDDGTCSLCPKLLQVKRSFRQRKEKKRAGRERYNDRIHSSPRTRDNLMEFC